VLSQIMRDMAAGRPGLITKTGLHTFVDPRQQGARQSPRTPPDFVEVIELGGEEWLLFKPIPVTVAFLRGTTADEDGNVTMEEEAVPRRDARDGAGHAPCRAASSSCRSSAWRSAGRCMAST
jgi:propionate CoA-transferase